MPVSRQRVYAWLVGLIAGARGRAGLRRGLLAGTRARVGLRRGLLAGRRGRDGLNRGQRRCLVEVAPSGLERREGCAGGFLGPLVEKVGGQGSIREPVGKTRED